METKFCKDCKWSILDGRDRICLSPKRRDSDFDPVEGKTLCILMRGWVLVGGCCKEGEWFENDKLPRD